MHLRPGQVSFVENERGQRLAMFQQRPGRDLRFTICIDIGVVHEVAWHEIDGALDALVTTAECTRHGAQQGRLADTHIALENDVPAGEGRYAKQPHGLVLADHYRPDRLLDCDCKGLPTLQMAFRLHFPCHENSLRNLRLTLIFRELLKDIRSEVDWHELPLLTPCFCSASMTPDGRRGAFAGVCEIVKSVAIALSSCLLLLPAIASANDFPTQARVEYVLRCMDSHGGQKYANLYSCICVIDKIAEKLAYDEFSEGEVYSQLRSTPGERGGMFRDPDHAVLLVEKLNDITTLAEKSCFVGHKTDAASEG